MIEEYLEVMRASIPEDSDADAFVEAVRKLIEGFMAQGMSERKAVNKANQYIQRQARQSVLNNTKITDGQHR